MRLVVRAFGCLLFLNAYVANAQKQSVAIDSLLRYARIAFSKNSDHGITLAKQAYTYSIASNSIIHKIKSLNLLADFYETLRQYKNAAKYVQSGLQAAQTSGIDSLIGDSWILKGIINSAEHKYDRSIEDYHHAIPHYFKAKLPGKLAIAYHNLGYSEKQLSHFTSSNSFFFKAAEIFLRLDDRSNLSHAYNSIGLCFISLKNYKKAVFYHQKALSIRLTRHDTSLIAQSFSNIGYTYELLGNADSAIFYLEKSLYFLRSEKQTRSLAIALQNLGAAWLQKGDLTRASDYLNQSLRIAEKSDMKEEILHDNIDLAKLYKANGEIEKALAAAEISQRLSIELHLPELLLESFYIKSDLLENSGRFRDALYYERKGKSLNDSLFNIASGRTITEIETKYQTKQKDRDIASFKSQSNLQKKVVEQQKYTIISLISAAIFLLALTGLAYYSYRRKTRDNMHIQTLMKELNHRTINNLQILSGLFTLQLAEPLGDDVKKSIAENSNRINAMNLIHSKLDFDQSDIEIEMHDYLSKLLNHIKDSFGDSQHKRITLNIKVESIKLRANIAVAIGLVVTEIAMNSFKHAVFNGDEGEISLGLKKEAPSSIILYLGDNGKEWKNKFQNHPETFGIRLVNLLAKQFGTKLEMDHNGKASYRMKIAI